MTVSPDSPFPGSWRLVSFEHFLPSGEVRRPFGDSPSGALLYQADGHMSAQLRTGNPKRFASDDDFRATTAEMAEAWQTYFGYWGTFKIDAEKGMVVHHVEGSLFPNWIGTEQVRFFRFDGPNRLTLEAQSAAGRYRLAWQRNVDSEPGSESV